MRQKGISQKGSENRDGKIIRAKESKKERKEDDY